MSKLLEKVAHTTEENEFYKPIPQGYTVGKTKYIVVYGTVMSGLGKGIFAGSLAKLLQLQGISTTLMKFDGYLNADAGTLNPFRHGEVFVLDDGTESDMDLGTYERFLERDITKHNYLTGGKLFSTILNREREGSYLGRDVQFVPHVTGEIKHFVRTLAMSSGVQVVFVEVGGTVGDIENNYFIEAMRELEYEEGKENVIHVALTYVLEPGFLGEQKSKAAQLGLRELMAKGIQPQIIACRCDHEVTKKVREKISVSANVPMERVVSIHDCESVYLLPELLEKAKLHEQTINLLGLQNQVKPLKTEQEHWKQFVHTVLTLQKEVTIGMMGKYTQLRDSYASILKALEHAGVAVGVKVNIKWVDTTELAEDAVIQALQGVDGIIVPGAFGSRGAEGKIACIKHVREKNIPYLGLCFGFQMALIEFARHVCGLQEANSGEIAPSCGQKVIDILPEQKEISTMGGNMRLGGHDVEVKKGTKAYHLYGKALVRERFRHRWECNPDYISAFEQKGIVFSGKAPGREIMQILELPNHPFFIGTQFHPEYISRPLKPHPLYVGFLKAAMAKKKT